MLYPIKVSGSYREAMEEILGLRTYLEYILKACVVAVRFFQKSGGGLEIHDL